MASNLRIYIRSIQDKFMFFRFFNEFYTYLAENVGMDKKNFFENNRLANEIKSAKKEYKVKQENIFAELNQEAVINFIK